MNLYLEKLKFTIEEASKQYYAGVPRISDDEFDDLLEELKSISPHDILLQTTAYGYSPLKDTFGEKAKHKYMKVGSLDKINAETCEKYFAPRLAQYIITSKIDGGSVVCYYDNEGKLDKAITRGDGNIGIDCTSKLRYLVPETVNIANIAVRGEIIMSKDTFAKFYPDAASPRNSALGIINKDEPTIEEIERLSFVTYNAYGNDLLPAKKSEIMEWLKDRGFVTAHWGFHPALVPNFLESLKGEFDPEYPADGLVITNESDRFKEIAYKFVAETAETTVTEIEWEVSRLGNVIPVVHFNPVKLSGAMLAKCSGFNAKWIKDNIVGQGAVIRIHRAGEVIPYCTEVLIHVGTIFPTNCPDCSTELEWKGVHLYCPNQSCPKKIQSSLLHWIEIMAPVDSLGENILVPFIDEIAWKTPEDIYNDSSLDIWHGILSFQSESYTSHAQKLLWQMYGKLYESPVNPDKFFAAFGLPSVGETISKKISDEIGIHQYFYEDFPWTFVDQLSKKTAPAVESLYENYDLMKKVYQQIINRQGFIEKEKPKMKIKVAITGKLSKPRKELTEEFATHGIEVVSSITKECDYLITDDPASGSTKNVAAQKLSVIVLSETDFRQKLGVQSTGGSGMMLTKKDKEVCECGHLRFLHFGKSGTHKGTCWGCDGGSYCPRFKLKKPHPLRRPNEPHRQPEETVSAM
jgi:DNA ligase (NAD+)